MSTSSRSNPPPSSAQAFLKNMAAGEATLRGKVEHGPKVLFASFHIENRDFLTSLVKCKL